MDRYWLLTWTTYGTWLPGDERGFVTNVRAGEGPEVRHYAPGTEPDAKQRGLWLTAKANMEGPAVYLSAGHARLILEQFQETARFRGWELVAVAIMGNHIHLVVGVPGDPEPDTLLRDFKSYASRRLNKAFARPQSGTWWTESGSRRKLPDEAAVQRAVQYVKNQERPLLVGVKDETSGGRQPPDSRFTNQGADTENQRADAPRSPGEL
jgi:REP element-mobilizing transposase RayT